jgi:RNA polymerase sigma factor (sigma-70 family)
MSFKEDSYYIGEVLKGNTSAYAGLVEKYQSLAFNLAIRMLRNPMDAEEVAQDAFVKAYISLKSFKGNSKFSTWLYRIIYNTSVSMLRKKKIEMVKLEDRPDIEGSIIHPDTVGDEADFTLKALEKSLDSLESDEKFIVSLYYYENTPVDEIADITGLSKSNVKVKLFRARKKLHEKLVSLQITSPILN